MIYVMSIDVMCTRLFHGIRICVYNMYVEKILVPRSNVELAGSQSQDLEFKIRLVKVEQLVSCSILESSVEV